MLRLTVFAIGTSLFGTMCLSNGHSAVWSLEFYQKYRPSLEDIVVENDILTGEAHVSVPRSAWINHLRVQAFCYQKAHSDFEYYRVVDGRSELIQNVTQPLASRWAAQFIHLEDNRIYLGAQTGAVSVGFEPVPNLYILASDFSFCAFRN